MYSSGKAVFKHHQSVQPQPKDLHVFYKEAGFTFFCMREMTLHLHSLQVGLGLLATLIGQPPVNADELDLSKAAPSGTTLGEVFLLLTPLLLYGLFNVYRAKINPKASISDFLFFTAALVIVGNVFSILVLKVRLY